ncbi:ChaN family lipoprotein [Photobacterium rosenbergii]|uniref:ChaN family lipoprotein n=1 Tax=Photobacterium rosenbergii TaxID=294936 RepID=UPI001C9A0CA6|nr:ChaN family lipoprotein [Photobacterium rosenbergii]MBY5947942.1 ChaN family lipoprotein [Photobacterium rosenbergii]
MKKWLSLGLASLMFGCTSHSDVNGIDATNATQPLPTMYDSTIQSPQGQPMTLAQLATALKDADIVLVGEWHGHPGAHLMQARLFAALYQQNPDMALSMEQFTRDKQHVVNQYLAGEIGEKTLIKEGKAWPNYSSDYRPLVEFAKMNQLDIIAANAPKSIVRCIGQQGEDYLTLLPAIERKWVAEQLTLSDDAYHTKFNASMHHGDEEKTKRQFAAQTAWDDTMAESMVDYLALHPGRQIIHVAGRFHVAEGLGTASRITTRNPDLKVMMVTPVTEKANVAEGSPDFTFEVMPLPTAYVDKDKMKAAMQQIYGRNKGLECYK